MQGRMLYSNKAMACRSGWNLNIQCPKHVLFQKYLTDFNKYMISKQKLCEVYRWSLGMDK